MGSTKLDPDGLTIKERKFVNNLADNGGNGTQAAIDSGFSNGTNRATAATTASELLRKPKIVQAMQKAMNSHGLTLDALAGHMTIIVTEGASADNLEKADPSEKLKAAVKMIDIAAKLHDAVPDRHVKVESHNYNHELRRMTEEQLLAELEVIEGEVVED